MALKSFCGLKERVLACADFRTILVKPSYFTYFSQSDSQWLFPPSDAKITNPQPCHNSRRSALWSLSPCDRTGRYLGCHCAQHTPRHFYTLPRPETFSLAFRNWLCGTIATARNPDSKQDVFYRGIKKKKKKGTKFSLRKLFCIVSVDIHSQHTEEMVGLVRLWVLSLETWAMRFCLFCLTWCATFSIHTHVRIRFCHIYTIKP